MTRKPKPPVKVRATVRIRAYPVIANAISGCGLAAIYRTYKHRDDSLPDDVEHALADALEHEVLSRLCDVIDFGDGEP